MNGMVRQTCELGHDVDSRLRGNDSRGGSVIPVKTGIQVILLSQGMMWIPACAGMTAMHGNSRGLLPEVEP